MDGTFAIYCGVDVGKWSHHVVAIDASNGEILVNRKIAQCEHDIALLLDELKMIGSVKLVVDQPGSMAALLLAVAKSKMVETGFITPKAMARAIDMYGGDLKTDAHDALIIAEVASSLPKLVKKIDERSGERHTLGVLMNYDRELTSEATRATNRLHDLLLSVCPELEFLLQGKKIQGNLYLSILGRYGGPSGLRRAGRGNVRRWVRSRRGFGEAAVKKVDELFEAVARQKIVITGSEETEQLIQMEADYLAGILSRRKTVAQRRDSILETLPEAKILRSLPGVGSVTCATFIAEVGDIERFSSSAKLASYAGLSPRVRQSGKSINSVTKPRSGNKRLKRVLVLSASKSLLFHEESRAYYDRKRSEGRCYNSAITALARKRLDVMYAMLRDGRLYQKKNG